MSEQLQEMQARIESLTDQVMQADVPAGLEDLRDLLSQAKYRAKVAKEYLETVDAMMEAIAEHLENIMKERNER